MVEKGQKMIHGTVFDPLPHATEKENHHKLEHLDRLPESPCRPIFVKREEQSNQSLCLVLKHTGQKPVMDVLTRRPVSPAYLHDVAVQIAKGLQFLRQHELINTDLRPATVLLTQEDPPVVQLPNPSRWEPFNPMTGVAVSRSIHLPKQAWRWAPVEMLQEVPCAAKGGDVYMFGLTCLALYHAASRWVTSASEPDGRPVGPFPMCQQDKLELYEHMVSGKCYVPRRPELCSDILYNKVFLPCLGPLDLRPSIDWIIDFMDQYTPRDPPDMSGRPGNGGASGSRDGTSPDTAAKSRSHKDENGKPPGFGGDSQPHDYSYADGPQPSQATGGSTGMMEKQACRQTPHGYETPANKTSKSLEMSTCSSIADMEPSTSADEHCDDKSSSTYSTPSSKPEYVTGSRAKESTDFAQLYDDSLVDRRGPESFASTSNVYEEYDSGSRVGSKGADNQSCLSESSDVVTQQDYYEQPWDTAASETLCSEALNNKTVPCSLSTTGAADVEDSSDDVLVRHKYAESVAAGKPVAMYSSYTELPDTSVQQTSNPLLEVARTDLKRLPKGKSRQPTKSKISKHPYDCLDFNKHECPPKASSEPKGHAEEAKKARKPLHTLMKLLKKIKNGKQLSNGVYDDTSEELHLYDTVPFSEDNECCSTYSWAPSEFAESSLESSDSDWAPISDTMASVWGMEPMATSVVADSLVQTMKQSPSELLRRSAFWRDCITAEKQPPQISRTGVCAPSHVQVAERGEAAASALRSAWGTGDTEDGDNYEDIELRGEHKDGQDHYEMAWTKTDAAKAGAFEVLLLDREAYLQPLVVDHYLSYVKANQMCGRKLFVFPSRSSDFFDNQEFNDSSFMFTEVEISKCDLVLQPVLCGSRWVLLSVCPQTSTLHVFNPSSDRHTDPSVGYATVFSNYLRERRQWLRVRHADRTLRIWRQREARLTVPADDHNTGFMTLMYAWHLSQGVPEDAISDVTEADIPAFRRFLNACAAEQQTAESSV